VAHHKRGRPKNRRAGCLLCKSWKINGFARTREGSERFSDHRRRLVAGGEVIAWRGPRSSIAALSADSELQSQTA
jgi:hypothetical protein